MPGAPPNSTTEPRIKPPPKTRFNSFEWNLILSPDEEEIEGRLWKPAVAASGSLLSWDDACHCPRRLADSLRAEAMELRKLEDPALASINCFKVFHSLQTWHCPDHCTKTREKSLRKLATLVSQLTFWCSAPQSLHTNARFALDEAKRTGGCMQNNGFAGISKRSLRLRASLAVDRSMVCMAKAEQRTLTRVATHLHVCCLSSDC